MKNVLLLILADRISDLAHVGRIVDRYYNPGNVFDEVHFIFTHYDNPEAEDVQKLVGKAKWYIHNLHRPSPIGTLGWQPIFLQKWVREGIKLAKEINPTVIRVHNNFYNGYLAAKIKHEINVPLIVSMHTNPDDTRQLAAWSKDWRKRLEYELMLPFERVTLAAADKVIIVYDNIRDYAIQRGAKLEAITLSYNVINPDNLQTKRNYALQSPPQVLYVGRLFLGKGPDNIIRAMAKIEGQLTIIGDGPYREDLITLGKTLGIEDKLKFIRSMPNDELCQILHEFDLFVIHNDYWGMPRTVMEAALTGLPIIHNFNKDKMVAEFDESWIRLVENTPDAYYKAIMELLADQTQRESFGKAAYAYANQHFHPQNTEHKLVSIYSEFLP